MYSPRNSITIKYTEVNNLYGNFLPVCSILEIVKGGLLLLNVPTFITYVLHNFPDCIYDSTVCERAFIFLHCNTPKTPTKSNVFHRKKIITKIEFARMMIFGPNIFTLEKVC